MSQRVQKPPNHGSAKICSKVLLTNIRKEQDAGWCIVVDMDIFDIWDNVLLSPFGVVAKAGSDPTVSGRTTHDLSYPESVSINDVTAVEDTSAAFFEPCTSVAKQILATSQSNPSTPVKLMAGDVNYAYRHVAIHSESVYLFAGQILEANALVIDLCAPFGWTLSPAEHEVYGGAISHVHGSTQRTQTQQPFYAYHWVDDHVNVAPDHSGICAEAERSLRRAMLAVLGSLSFNEDKFTGWHQCLQVLGLIFDSGTLTVSMPPSKVDKAKTRISLAISAISLSRTEFRSLLGSLRHVAMCIRPARAFLQRLRASEYGHTRSHKVPVTDSMKEDLQ